MKVVFLDIDGVLNEEKSRSHCCGYKGIDDKKVENLAKIIKTTNAAIVLISTWKDDWFRPSLIFPEYRKQGIATHILSLLEEEAKNRNVYSLTLNATVHGLSLYEKNGYHEGFLKTREKKLK